MDAVLAVSSFHLSASRGRGISFQSPHPGAGYHLFATAESFGSEELYLRAIQGLQRRQNIADYKEEDRLAILLSILVLQITVMVTGSNDFPILFRMMESALNAIGGEHQLGSGELSRFMARQIHKYVLFFFFNSSNHPAVYSPRAKDKSGFRMRVYGAPFLSEESGINILSSEQHFRQMFDCLKYCAQQQPNSSANVPRIMKLIQQAHKIYLRQAQCHKPLAPLLPIPGVLPLGLFAHEESFSESVELVQQYKDILEGFTPGSVGEEVLTWATFIAASDCILTEHMAFFEAVFLRYYTRSGFCNVLTGLEYLQHIWKERSRGIRWTSVLPQMRVIIM